MAVDRYQVRLLGTSGLPEDVFENVLYFDTNTPDSREGCADGIAAAYDAYPHSAGWDGLEVRVYELAGGQPIESHEYPTVAGKGTVGATEVAVCLSYATVDDPEVSTGRRRGRIYVGPLAASNVTGARPSSGVIDAVLDLGEALASIGTADLTTWHMFSRTDNVAVKIESIWCDDAWDTQRRRGLAPTMREVRDVQ